MSAKTYLVINGPMPTTAAPASVTTGTVVKTMLQIVPAQTIRIVEWGYSFDGVTPSNVPGKVELLTTGSVAGTVTAYAAADVMPHNDPNAPANTAGSSGVPLNLGTALSGYTCTSEGSITAVRELDPRQDNPTLSYYKQFPLGREPEVKAAEVMRIRMTFAVAVNAYCFCIFEV